MGYQPDTSTTKKENSKRLLNNFFAQYLFYTLCIFLTIVPFNSKAQLAPGYYYVQLTDKVGTPFSVNQPEDFLSSKAILRRQNQGINIKSDDLPVNPTYVDSVRNTGAVQIHHQLKWANGLVIFTYDTVALDAIKQLSFVDSSNSILSRPNLDGKRSTSTVNKFAEETIDTATYGYSSGQIEQLSLQYLHNDGFQGQGMLIAVMDAGFSRADTFPALSHLFQNGKVLKTHDFVQEIDTLDFYWSTHGTYVLGTLAAVDSGLLMGTAPEADYLLLRSENVLSEYILEEYHWAAAAQYADSMGADILTTSLGYTTFDDSLQDHTYEELDGKSTFITRMANRAANKGMLVVNSAGNSGGNSWRYISAPADGDSVFTIGAVGVSDTIAGFSSRGPNSAGELKPNVMACGYLAASVGFTYPVEYINGTSFSCPILAGAAACLWQANPGKSNVEIQHMIEESSDRFSNPDNDYGYGIPNFAQAYWITTGVQENEIGSKSFEFYPNPASTKLWLNNSSKTDVQIYSVSGNLISNQSIGVGETVNLNGISNGIYILKCGEQSKKLIIQH